MATTVRQELADLRAEVASLRELVQDLQRKALMLRSLEEARVRMAYGDDVPKRSRGRHLRVVDGDAS